MARIQEYFESRRDLGPPAAVAYLDSWLSTRAGLNAALMAEEMKPGVDPARLAEQEARVRDALGKLYRAKSEYERAVAKGDKELEKEALRQWGGIARANIAARAKERVAQIGAEVDIRELQEKVNVKRQNELREVKNPLAGETLDNLYDNQKNNPREGLVGDLARAIEGVLRQEGLQATPGARARDAIVRRAIDGARKAGDHKVAQALAERFGAKPGQSWEDYMDEKHGMVTDDKVRQILDDLRHGRAGGDPDTALEVYAQLAGEGGGVGERVMVGTITSPTPEGMDKAIADMEKAADDLAAARDAAMKRQSSAFRPRPNWMITNPNQYVDPAEAAALRLWGRFDPVYVDEVEQAIEREGKRGARRELERLGGVSSEAPADEERAAGYAWADERIATASETMSGQALKEWANDLGAELGADEGRGRGIRDRVNREVEGLREVEPEGIASLSPLPVTAAERGKAAVEQVRERASKKKWSARQEVEALQALAEAQSATEFGAAVKSAVAGRVSELQAPAMLEAPAGGKAPLERALDTDTLGLADTTVEGKGGWRYTLLPQGGIRREKEGHATDVVQPGSKAHDAISREIGERAPAKLAGPSAPVAWRYIAREGKRPGDELEIAWTMVTEASEAPEPEPDYFVDEEALFAIALPAAPVEEEFDVDADALLDFATGRAESAEKVSEFFDTSPYSRAPGTPGAAAGRELLPTEAERAERKKALEKAL